MPVELKMPALSPTMEEGTLAKWHVKVGDAVTPGALLADIETDKATMEFETINEGVVGSLDIAEGTEGVRVGTVIATLLLGGEEGTGAEDKKATPPVATPPAPPAPIFTPPAIIVAAPTTGSQSVATATAKRVIASPLAKRIAGERGVDLSSISGTGPNGRIVKADVETATQSLQATPTDAPTIASPPIAGPATSTARAPTEPPVQETARVITDIPYETEKLGNVRKTIARRLTEAKRDIPHIYLTVDVQLDQLFALRTSLNDALAARDVKLSVNDLLIKALAKALVLVPQCNVRFAGDELLRFHRADISVAVAAPSGLITPIIKNADDKAVSAINAEMKGLAGKAREGKLRPEEYQGGTASLSNLGMFGIKQFEAVINPPQAMIMAVGAGELRPHVVDGQVCPAMMMSATGSFDHRAIDGADGAALMDAFKKLIEQPFTLLA